MFVTFEGIEGSGKSTLMAALASELKARGTTCLLTREPGGTPLGESLRSVFVDPRSRIDPLAEVFLLCASRAQLVAEVIRPALARKETVLCDRFFDATIAYQGYGRGLDPQMLLDISRTVTGGLEPDLTLLLDLPIEISMRRVAERNRAIPGGNDRLEMEAADFHERVRRGYLALAERFERFVVLDATAGPDALRGAALDALSARVR